jgi:hypothetical protein
MLKNQHYLKGRPQGRLFLSGNRRPSATRDAQLDGIGKSIRSTPSALRARGRLHGGWMFFEALSPLPYRPTMTRRVPGSSRVLGLRVGKGCGLRFDGVFPDARIDRAKRPRRGLLRLSCDYATFTYMGTLRCNQSGCHRAGKWCEGKMPRNAFSKSHPCWSATDDALSSRGV